MAKFRGSVLTCAECGAEFRVPPSRAGKAVACSLKCASAIRGRQLQNRVVLQCRHCAKPFAVPKCHAERRVYCSRECQEKSSETITRKVGRVGSLNPSWKGGVHKTSSGYLYENAYGHPLAAPNGYVLQHRLVMERWLREHDPASPFLMEIDGQLYLSPAYHVHHKDEDKQNNSIDNLQCMTPEEHRIEHNAFVRKALKFYRQHLKNKGN